MSAEIKILVAGIHQMIGDEKLDVACTTTLIKSNKNIVVDPGSYINKDRVAEGLRECGLSPEDIDAVILTHSHLDHIANVFLFPAAKIFMRFISGNYPGQFQLIKEGTVNRFNLIEEPIADGVKIIDTIGHAIDHISVAVDTKDGKIVIAGDAVAGEVWADIIKQPNPDFVYSVEKYNESRKKILEMADYIIPGHGDMFKNIKK